jgi:nucleotide-binding universal stress UspA family protein
MYRTILIATDGSDLSSKAVAHGLALAKATGAQVAIVTVTEMWSISQMASRAELGDGFATEDYEKRARVNALAILSDAAEKAVAAGVACKTIHVPDSRPAAGILKAAAETGCDLIVMSSHGRGGLTRVVMGSQASDVMSGATVPVLVCR